MDLPLLDLQALDRLRLLQADGEPDLVAELVTMFLAEAPQRLAAMSAATDAATRRRVAHDLRGIAGQLGAARLARACAAVEDAEDGASVDDVGRELEAVRPLLLAAAARA